MVFAKAAGYWNGMRKVSAMSPEARNKKGRTQPKSGVTETLQGVLERLRQGLEDLVGSLTTPRREPVPIPIPVPARRTRR